MLRNLWKSALLGSVAICGSSLGHAQEVIGAEKSHAILQAAGNYIPVQHHGGGGHMGGGHMGGGAMHNGGAMHSGGGTYHSGVNANRAPMGTHQSASGAHWGSGTGIRMSHGNVNLGHHGSNAGSGGVQHVTTTHSRFPLHTTHRLPSRRVLQ